jgi:hypothetical protein
MADSCSGCGAIGVELYQVIEIDALKEPSHYITCNHCGNDVFSFFGPEVSYCLDEYCIHCIGNLAKGQHKYFSETNSNLVIIFKCNEEGVY